MFYNNLELFTDPKNKAFAALGLNWTETNKKPNKPYKVCVCYNLLTVYSFCTDVNHASPLFSYSFYLLLMFIKHTLHDYIDISEFYHVRVCKWGEKFEIICIRGKPHKVSEWRMKM